jgi:hypothetical protein
MTDDAVKENDTTDEDSSEGLGDDSVSDATEAGDVVETEPDGSDEPNSDQTAAAAATAASTAPTEDAVGPDDAATTSTTEVVSAEESRPEFQRVCRKCSASVLTSSMTCPACGAPYVRQPMKRRTKIIAAVVAVLVIFGTTGGIAYAKHQSNERALTAKRAKAAKERKAEERAARKEREQQEAAEAAEQAETDRLAGIQAMRDAGVAFAEKTITADAKKKVQAGTLSGPILLTQCSPIAGGVEDVTAATEKYDCIVATEKNGSQLHGYSVEATYDYTEDSVQWKYGG